MNIDRIINIIREQRILKEFGLPPGVPGLSGGGGGTNVITSQAKARTIRSMLTDPTGSKLRRQQHNDPQNYLTDADYKNRNKNLPPKPERKSYKEEMTLGAGGIAGTVEDSNYDPNFTPPVGKRKKKKYIYQKGMRKWWMGGNR